MRRPSSRFGSGRLHAQLGGAWPGSLTGYKPCAPGAASSRDGDPAGPDSGSMFASVGMQRCSPGPRAVEPVVVAALPGVPMTRRPAARPGQSVLSPHSRFALLVPSPLWERRACPPPDASARRTAAHGRRPVTRRTPRPDTGVGRAVLTVRGGADCG